MKKLEVRLTLDPTDLGELPVGTLAEQRRRVFFEYDPRWLERRIELSPLTLACRAGLIEHTDRAFGPLPGLFDDSLPDGWGLLLIDRHLRRLGLDPAGISALDRLAYLGTFTMGALTYHPPAEREAVDEASFDLHDLARQAREVLAGPAGEVLPQLLRAGGSPGGARPKVLVGLDPRSGALLSGEDDLPPGFEHWLVKFHTEAEVDAGPVEYAYSLMARKAGLTVPETRLFDTAGGDRFFGTRRFDRRTGNRRVHVHTFGNLIHADFRVPCCDYAELLKVASALTRDHRDLLRAYRWTAFNVAAHNRDDHVKNFAFVLDVESGRWSLSPAYDLTYASGPGGEHTTTVDGEGAAPTTKHLLRLAVQAGIDRADARAVIEEVWQATALWPRLAEEAGVSRAVRQSIGRRLLGAR